ncbi:MAG: DEAD/DEAH box helicase family protein, partial [Actinomycetia bacterium]|nr:DEAD/DEAH box helicase family protein [Actinomycetes bacterium]
MSASSEPSRPELLAEVDELRAEVARLHDLLGLAERTGDQHRRSWAPTLFGGTNPTPEVTRDSPPAEKLELIRSLFGARADVYAQRWENQNTGRSGWSPAVRGGWSNKARKAKDYLPLTDEVFASHLRGDTTIGIYPLLRGDTCALLAGDFDDGSWALDALAFLDECHTAGVPAVLERSRSGDGGHVWVFFDQPVAATAARAMGMGLLRQAMTKRAELDLASYDRFFPSQDFMPKGSFGNLIALPLHGERATHGCTVFLDPTTMEPWPDQWAFLSSVSRMSSDAVVALADSLRTVAAGPGLSLADLADADGPKPPPVIDAQIAGMLSLRRAGLPPALVAGLKHLGSLANPEFHEKERMRFSTWDTPRFIRCYREDLEWLHLPRGLLGQVTELVEAAGSQLDLADKRPEHASIELDATTPLRTHQQAAVDAVIDHELAVIVAPPGSGKTVTACAVIAHHRQPTLILVDRKPLLAQWSDRLGQHLGLADDQIGVIGGGKAKTTGIVDIAMIQSLARREHPEEVFANYGLVVVDECHHLPAVSFEGCVRTASTRRWLGLTATPYRRDGLEGIVALQCGPTRHETRPGDVAETALVQRRLIVHPTRFVLDDDTASIQAVFGALADDKQRTEQMCQDVATAATAGRTCLVLTQRTSHIDAIVERLAKTGHSAYVLKGGLGKKALAAVHEAMANPASNTGLVVVATGSYLGEGFDWPELDTLFLAFPIAFKGRVVQYVGRLLRAHGDKHDVELHDYLDEHVAVLARMHTKR